MVRGAAARVREQRDGQVLPLPQGVLAGQGEPRHAGGRARGDERTSEVYNYSGREDVLHKEIVLASELAGRTDTSWARERAALWNAAEHGTRRNARLAREVLVTSPPELGQAQRTELARTFARQLADRYRCTVDLAVHAPRSGSDPRHHHAHLLMTAREVTPEGLGRRRMSRSSASRERNRERYASHRSRGG
jgi:hypothetical protein